jgi:hypothetical protein
MLDYYPTYSFKSGGFHPSGFKILPSSRRITLPVALSILAKLDLATSSQAHDTLNFYIGIAHV